MREIEFMDNGSKGLGDENIEEDVDEGHEDIQ